MRILKSIAVIAITGALTSCNGGRTAVKSLETEIDSVSYAVGVNLSKQIGASFEEVNKDLFIQGFLNGLDSTNVLLEDKDIQKTLSVYFQKKQAEKSKLEMEKAAIYKEEGIAFLEENKNKSGVKTTASGLQYEVMKKGNGKKPAAESTVKIHYHGTTLDGTVFDSSVDRGTPIEMKVNQFVSGFSEGLELMNVGSKYKLFIPQELAYGSNPRPGGVIKPFMTLIFEVELLEIKN